MRRRPLGPPSSRTPTRRASRRGRSTSSPRSSRRSPTPGSSVPSPCRPPNEIRRRRRRARARGYWQQRADYSIKATLDTAAKRLTATEQIRYTNNSPDTLRFVWMQVDQNLFRPGSTGSLLFAAESRFGGAGFPGGFEIASITQSSPPQAGAGARPARGRRALAPATVRPLRPRRRSSTGWTTP